MLPPTAFMSYPTSIDKLDDGVVSYISQILCAELQEIYSSNFQIFQDCKSIRLGEDWREKIDLALDNSTIFIAFITPNYFKSKYCQYELEKFFEKESHLGFNRLIFPIYYIKCANIDSPIFNSDQPVDQLAAEISKRQRSDWLGWRRRRDFVEARNKIEDLAIAIKDALECASSCIENIEVSKSYFRTELNEIYSKTAEYKISQETQNLLLQTSLKSGLSREMATNALNTVLQEKEKFRSKKLSELDHKAQDLLSEIEFYSCQDILLKSFKVLQDKLHLHPEDKAVEFIRNTLLEKFRKRQFQARKYFKSNYRRWLLGNSSSSDKENAIAFYRNKAKLNIHDTYRIVKIVDVEIQIRETLENTKRLVNRFELLVRQNFIPLIIDLCRNSFRMVFRAVIFLMSALSCISKKICWQKIKKNFNREVILRLCIFWKSRSQKAINFFICLNHRLKDCIISLNEKSTQRLSIRCFRILIILLFLIGARSLFFMLFKDLFVAPISIESLTANKQEEKSLFENQNFIEALVKNRISEYLKARANAYGENRNLEPVRSLTSGQSLTNIETRTFELSNNNEFLSFPVSKLDFLEKVDFDSDSIYAEAKLYEMRELYTIGEKVARFSTCEYIDAKLIFEQHDSIWKISQITYSNKNPC